MIDELISVIIPVYNVEMFLGDCIESVINQTYKYIEIVLVDDGSTDKSGAICDKYKETDGRVVVFHQRNQGLSGARNTGIRNARGSYLTFIDSDDYVSPFYVETLLMTMEKENSLLAACDFVSVKETENYDYDVLIKKEIKRDVFCKRKDEAIKEVYKREIHCMDFVSVAKLYNISLFYDNEILFPIGKLHEDAFTTYRLMYFSNIIAFTQNQLYFYRTRKGSITNSKFTKKRLDKLEATRKECEFFLEKKEYDLLKVALFDHLHETQILLREMEKEEKQNQEMIREVVRRLKEDICKYQKIIKIPLKKKCYYKLISLMPTIVKVL